MNADVEPLVWPAEGVSRVPYRIYGDPDIYGGELESVFRGPVWNFLGMGREIPEPGDYRTTHIGETPVIMLRGEDGAVNALVNRCAHRGNMVCIANKGKAENGRLTCVYHNWAYDLEGNLKSVAFGKGIGGKGGMPKDFDRADHGMTRLRVEVFHDLVFASFSDDVAPFADHIGPEMVENMDRLVGRGMEIIGTYRQRMPNNWKLYMENVRDSYHASLLHVFFTTFRINRLSMDGGIKLSDRGWHHISHSALKTDREEDQYAADKLRAVDDEFRLAEPGLIQRWDEFECGTTLAIQSIFPNFILQQHLNAIALRVCLPKGPDDCELLWWVLGATEDTPEQRKMRIRQSNLAGPGGLISMEDGIIGNWVTRGIKGDADKTSIVEMGGRDVAASKASRTTEVSVRGFWAAYRECMGL